MNTKKLIVFLLWAFLPMVIVEVVMHLIGASTAGLSEDSIDTLAVIKGMVLSAGAMFTPLLAIILTQLIFKEPVLKNLDISFKINRWWWLGWLLMPFIAFAVLGVTLLMPGAKWTPDSEMILSVIQSLPEGIGVWGIMVITVVSGLMSGITINAVFALGEEIAWRGFLLKEFKGKKFLVVALWIGIIWGLWHAPLTIAGHNFGTDYAGYPFVGILMMCLFCVMMNCFLTLVTEKTRSIYPASFIHMINNNLSVGILLMNFGSETAIQKTEGIHSIESFFILTGASIVTAVISFIIFMKKDETETASV